MAVDQIISSSTDVVTVPGVARGIMLMPTFQRGYVSHVIDGFRFTLNVVSATMMPTKIFRYRVVPTKMQANASEPPTAIELKGFFDGVCSPADLEDFPEDWPLQNARPPWYRLDYIDLIVRSRTTCDQAYAAVLAEVQSLVDALDLLDKQEASPPIFIGTPYPAQTEPAHADRQRSYAQPDRDREQYDRLAGGQPNVPA
jgi:hypothetical protein